MSDEREDLERGIKQDLETGKTQYPIPQMTLFTEYLCGFCFSQIPFHPFSFLEKLLNKYSRTRKLRLNTAETEESVCIL